jgi:hypothetical protein
MTQEFDLTFQYKGARDYVHGTDIYNLSVEALKKLGYSDLIGFDMSFHKVIEGNLRCEIFEGKSISSSEDLAVLIRFRNNNTDYVLSMRENGEPIEGRYPYPEDEICQAGVIDFEARSIKLTHFSGHTIIEKIVALNKHLLSQLFKEELGKWYFGKLQLDKDISVLDIDNFQIKLERNIGVKFTKSTIILNGEQVGSIFFSMKF